MERSKVTCPIQVCWRKLGPHQEGLLWPSHEVHWTPCWLGSYFSSSSLMVLSYTNSLLTFAIDKLPWWFKRVWFPSSAPPSLFFWRASGLLLEGTTLSLSPSTSSMCCSFLPGSFWADTACTGVLFRAAYSLGATNCVSGFPPLWRLSYDGLAGPRYLLEKNFWEDSECRLAACSRQLFHSVSQSPGLVKLPCALQPTGMR